MKTILFDFDGTLIDSQIWYNIAISKVLKRFNEKYTQEFCADYFDGRCWQEVILQIAKDEKFDSIAVLNEAVEVAHKLILENVKINEGVPEILEILSQSNAKYAICSNSNVYEIVAVLEKCNLLKFFDGKIFGREMVKNGKPESDIYLLGMEKLGVLPHETFAIEDSISGAKASIKANIPTIIFTGGSHFKEESKQKFIENFGEVPFFSNMIHTINYAVNA